MRRCDRGRVTTGTDDETLGNCGPDASRVIKPVHTGCSIGGNAPHTVGFDSQRVLLPTQFENQFTRLFTGRADAPTLLTTKHAEEPN